MSERAFIKNVAGRMRVRIVRPGLDANDYGLPPGDVIFDSEAADGLPVLVSGSFVVGNDLDDWTIASWGNLGYKPFFVWTWTRQGGTSNTFALSSNQALFVGARPDRLSGWFAQLDYPFTIKYAVFRRPL